MMKFDMSELSTHHLKVTLSMAKQGQKYKAGIDSAVRAVKMVEDEIARREANQAYLVTATGDHLEAMARSVGL